MRTSSFQKNVVVCALAALVHSCGPCSPKNAEVIPNDKLPQNTAAFGSPVIKDTLSTTEDEFETCIVADMEWAPGSAESILLDPSSFIFPGNTLDASSLQNGKYQTLAGDRKPIRLSINSPIFNQTSIDVEEPSLSSVSDAIARMLKSGVSGSVAADVNISAQEVYSEDHLKLLVRSNYSGGFGSLSAGFDFSNSTVSSRYLLDVTQVYYSINMDAPADGFYERKPDGLAPTSFAPVYISSVKYGRRILIAVESKLTTKKQAADLRARINGIAASGSMDVNLFSENLFSDKSVKVLVKGGNAKNAFDIFRAVSNRQEIDSILSQDAQWSLNNLGVPLSFEVRNTKDNSLFYMAQAGKYRSRICTLKNLNDSIFNPASIQHICYNHVAGRDRNFGGNPDVGFSITIEPERNIVWCVVQSFCKETGGDGTAGSINARFKLIELPVDYTVIQINTPTSLNQPSVGLGNKGPNAFNYSRNEHPVSIVSVIGDSDGNNNDDLFPGGCSDDRHASIQKIEFSPLSFSYTRTKVKQGGS
ncbi:MAG: thiol-activated cytolysin family protein [Flavobacteriales bacterium]|nr:thiol-activated cytolysin family protein [Flavobacteriales bacterium]